jgi:hypothetical protein
MGWKRRTPWTCMKKKAVEGEGGRRKGAGRAEGNGR